MCEILFNSSKHFTNQKINWLPFSITKESQNKSAKIILASESY